MREFKTLSLKDLFESEEAKALSYFDLGTEKQLTDDGRNEYIDFVFSTGNLSREDFVSKVVDAYKKSTKKNK